ncbi:MAG: hypothetical protein SOR81_04080 [Fusobacterium sp.]|uniref:hypothetical protein n=1 Tax=Fusobacterium sp. TaxID=68766 RepID=UPI002A75D650|nr:hypothetical protein [Fusobacterium sp.]MDY2980770.1 hypothetical protein [Fusobacterium sp.]
MEQFFEMGRGTTSDEKLKKVLFSTDGILGYKESIQKELEKRFEYVKYIEKDIHQDCKKDIFYKILREISKKLNDKNFLKKLFKKYQQKYIDKLMDNFSEKFDYFFVVAGQEFSKEFINELRKRNPKIKCIFFLWDSLELTALKNSAFEYDYIFSFDKEDCQKYNFYFRESFYTDECLKNISKFSEKKYDICYIGGLRDRKRYEIIKEFQKYCDNYNLKSFFRIFYNKKLIKILNKEEREAKFLTEEKISYDKNQEIAKNSRVILDLNAKGQSGLTLRVPEAIASDTKIITTNQNIKEYDFYNENNVYILEKIEDIKNIPITFFKEECQVLDHRIKRRYSTEGFVEEIFNVVEGENNYE